MDYKIVNIEELSKAFQEGPIAFDTETDGKYGPVKLAQFYQRGWPAVLILYEPEPITLFAILSQLPNTLVMQNASYDISTIQRQTGAPFIPKSFDDTLLLARLAWPKNSVYSLDELIKITLGYCPYAKAGVNKSDMHKASWKIGSHVSHEKYTYASLDVWHLLDLYDKVKHVRESFLYKLDMHTLCKALDFQRNGMVVDKDRVRAMLDANNKRITEIALPINANSYKQVRPYIGSDASDALGLATLTLKGNTKAAAVNETRKLLKQNSFLNKYITADSKIYGIFGPYARSGRFTCSDDNLQQLPRKTKGCFTVEPGRRMLYADFSQLELRSIGAITGDRKLCETYYNYGDVHNLVRDMCGTDRQVAKTINFNGLYGGGANMLRSILIREANILLPAEQVARDLKKWKNLFPGIAAWQERGIRDYHAGRTGRTVCGREYVGKLMTDQLNIENQGTGAEVAKLAMHYMYDEMKGLDCNLMNFIHDSYIYDVPDDSFVVAQASSIIAEAMKEAWVEVTKQAKVSDIPMPVTVLGGYNWGDIEAGEYDYKYEL